MKRGNPDQGLFVLSSIDISSVVSRRSLDWALKWRLLQFDIVSCACARVTVVVLQHAANFSWISTRERFRSEVRGLL